MSTMISFPNVFNVSSGKVATVSGDAASRQAMKCVCLSNIGELLGDPMFGSDIKSLIFELKNQLFVTLAKQKLSEAINKYVKTVQVNASDISFNLSENNTRVKLVINYTSKLTGETNLLEMTVLPTGQATVV